MNQGLSSPIPQQGQRDNLLHEKRVPMIQENNEWSNSDYKNVSKNAL